MTQNDNPGGNHSSEQGPPEDFSVVGIVTSPTSRAALYTLLGYLRPNANLSYLILQQAEYPEEAVELDDLAAHSTMPIYQAENHQELRKNCVYLLPPKSDGGVSAGRVIVNKQMGADDLGTMVNRFLFGLANSLGQYAVAVLLSKDGPDGLRGIDAIGLVHGLVVIEDSPYARQLADKVAETVSDRLIRVLSAKEMPEQIDKYVEFYSRNVAGTAADERDDLFAVLQQQTGVDFFSYKQASVLRRVHRRMQTKRVSTLGEYLEILHANHDEVAELYQELLIGVTYFFRDANAFAFLGSDVLPKIVEHCAEKEEIRIWVAGCSTGEEVYSIAMMLYPLLSDISDRSCKVFATDLDTSAIAVARLGVYPKEITERLTEDQMTSFFTHVGREYMVNREIRDMVIFAPHNILNDPPFLQMHLIVCRNLLIYLTPEMQHDVLALFHFALKPDGYLFLGPSESLGTLTKKFHRMDTSSNIFRRKEGQQEIPFHAFRTSPQNYDLRDERHMKVLHRLRETDRVLQIDGAFTKLLEDYVDPFIIVDENDDIIHINGNIGKYLTVPKGKLSQNLFRMIPNHLINPMRALLHKARREQIEVAYGQVSMTGAAQEDVVNLRARPLDIQGNQGQLAVFLFHPVTQDNQARPEVAVSQEAWNGENSSTNQQITDLQRELTSVKTTLQLTMEELEDARETFQTSNEELIVANEELQSSNEELQSLNEEFTAVNTEYQHKIQELTELNDDLDNLFASTDIATLILDAHADVRKCTPAMTSHFNLRDTDIGRSIHDMSHNLRCTTLVQDIRKVLQTHEVFEREVQDTAGRSFTMRLSPYEGMRELNQGVVMTLFDITELKSLTQRLLMFSYAIDQAPSFIVITDTARRIIYMNESCQQMTGYGADELQGEMLHLHSDRLSGGEIEAVWAAVEGGRAWTGELLGIKKSGEKFRQLVSLFPIKNDQGRITHFLTISEDLTERNQTLEALQRSEITSVMGQMAAGIAHEIRNPLTVLKGFTKLMEPETQRKEYIAMMLSEFNHIESIITELLQLSKPQEAHFERFDVLAPLRDVVMMMETQAVMQNVHISLHSVTPVPIVMGVPNQLKQVFMNVLKNGVEAMPRGGDLNIDVTWVNAQSIRIRFTDMGMGIPAHILAHIGDPFYTTKENGTGLGLMVSYKIIKNHQGEMIISSTYGAGTTVDILLDAEHGAVQRQTRLT